MAGEEKRRRQTEKERERERHGRKEGEIERGGDLKTIRETAGDRDSGRGQEETDKKTVGHR